MPTDSTSYSCKDKKVDTATSGPGAKATAKSSYDNGTSWISTSKDGETITKKIFGNNDDFPKQQTKDSDSESSWTLLGSRNSKESDEVEEKGPKASASAGKASSSASSGGSGGARAGVVNGKAFASAG